MNDLQMTGVSLERAQKCGQVDGAFMRQSANHPAFLQTLFFWL
jgi:hypothetical protein